MAQASAPFMLAAAALAAWSVFSRWKRVTARAAAVDQQPAQEQERQGQGRRQGRQPEAAAVATPQQRRQQQQEQQQQQQQPQGGASTEQQQQPQQQQSQPPPPSPQQQQQQQQQPQQPPQPQPQPAPRTTSRYAFAASPQPPPSPPAGGAAAPAQLAPEDAAAANEKLLAAYEQITDEFESSGLDLKIIADLQGYFDHTDPKIQTLPWPKTYTALAPPLKPLAPRTVRLLAVPLADNAPAVASLAAQVAAACLRQLLPGFKVFSNARVDYHITVFHTSQFQDTRPDPLSPSGGVDLAIPTDDRPGPSAAQLGAEVEAARRVVGASPPIRLELERVVLAKSGVLLLTWTDPTGALTALRRRLRDHFPGHSPKQPFTIHTSLWRIVGPPGAQLPPDAVRAVAGEARRWTEQVRGRGFTAHVVWHIAEAEYSTIRGDRELLRTAAAGAALN